MDGFVNHVSMCLLGALCHARSSNEYATSMWNRLVLEHVAMLPYLSKARFGNSGLDLL